MWTKDLLGGRPVLEITMSSTRFHENSWGWLSPELAHIMSDPCARPAPLSGRFSGWERGQLGHPWGTNTGGGGYWSGGARYMHLGWVAGLPLRHHPPGGGVEAVSVPHPPQRMRQQGIDLEAVASSPLEHQLGEDAVHINSDLPATAGFGWSMNLSGFRIFSGLSHPQQKGPEG